MATTLAHRLLGLEIDEVSSVDRPANQHGLVAITKRDEAGMGTGLYDAEGNEFDESELEAGMRAFDADGVERVLLSAEDAAALEAEGYDLDNLEIPDDASELDEEFEPELTLAGVGKAFSPGAGKNAAIQAGRSVKTKLLGLKDEADKHAFRATMRTRSAVGRRPIAAVTGAAAVGYGSGRVGKSLGETVLQELSKAYTDGDRDQVISKVATVVEKAERRAARAEQIAKALEERAELVEYVELAKSYELPVDETEFGVILQTIAKSGLSDDQLELVDRLFHTAGEALYGETGYTGRGDSPVMEFITGAAHEVVGKADVTVEQASVAVLEANPDAYVDYLREN